MIQLRIVAEFYRSLYGGERVRAPNIQMSVKFLDFVDQYLRSPFSGPKKERSLDYKPVHFVMITDSFIMLTAEQLKPLS